MCPPGLYAILLAKHVVRHDLGKIRMDRLKPTDIEAGQAARDPPEGVGLLTRTQMESLLDPTPGHQLRPGGHPDRHDRLPQGEALGLR
jgi:hypothetical protein